MPLLVRSQSAESWPPNTEVLAPVKENNQLYEQGSVLLMPHTVDGIGLELLEAMASGMPVIATDGQPWNEHPLLDKIRCTKHRKRVKRIIDWHEADPASLVRVCKRWLGKDISEQSKAAREHALQRRWQGRVPELLELVRTGRHRVTLPFTPVDAL
jgi:glycosyltransferase involved in cell wall biosynthesis